MEEEDEVDVTELIDFDTNDYMDPDVGTPKRDCDIELNVGMIFESVEDVQRTYSQYAKGKGFQVRKRNSRPKILQIVCYREGFPEVKKFKSTKEGEISHAQPIRYTKTGRIGCRACLYCSLDATSNMWNITKFFYEHNHEMVSPHSRKYLRTHKLLTNSAKCLSHVFESEGIGVVKVTRVLNPNPEDATFTKNDCWNYMTSTRRKILDFGDAQAVHAFCMRQQETNHNFRYAIQLDEEDRMLNFFWVDARSRSAYQIFGDVVSFDTTYKINKYNMPFAPFVGIDNHMHTIMFGCALLQDETEDTFVWLFESWLHAMDGKKPLSFVTDQDTAMMNAVNKVFPDVRHRLCLWHIKKKFPERLSHVYHDNSRFKQELNSCIHDSLSIEEFEIGWNKLVDEFNLVQNDWLKNLFEIRSKWVPIYLNGVFFGGLNTTGRSESINSFFDTFVHSGTTLKEFVHKYSQALENLYETYRRAEYDSRHKALILTIGIGLEEHAGEVYTAEIFKLFSIELIDSLLEVREPLFEGASIRTYRVSNRFNKDRSVVVEYNVSTQEAACQCRMFEFKGFLCKHILSVLFMYNVERIPECYILSRWTKEVGRILWESSIARDHESTYPIRYFEFRMIFDDIWKLCEKSDIAFEFAKKKLHVLYCETKQRVDNFNGELVGSSNPEAQTYNSAQQSVFQMKDPNVTQVKGMKKIINPRTSRIRSGIEIANDPRVRCSVCLKNRHNRRTCPTVRDSI